jgi:hypothetical protein
MERAADALNSFDTLVAGLSGATNPDLSFLQTFHTASPGEPRGGLGLIPLNQASVRCLPYKAQLRTS